MKRLVVFLLLSTSFHFALSQADYRPGFIITSTKDTVTGYILYTEANLKYTQCFFKQNLQDHETKYTTNQLAGYGLTNDSYFGTRLVKVNSTTKELFFAEILVKGRATLFKVHGNYYFEDSEQKIFPLEQITSEVVRENVRYLKTERKYLGILNWKFADCEKMKSYINDIELQERELTLAFEQYNSCFNQQSTSFKSQKPWSQHSIGVTGGGIFTKIIDLGELASVIDETQFSRDKGMFIGLSYTFTSPRISERFKLNINLAYQKASHQSIISSSTRQDIVNMHYSAIRIPLSVSYHFINSRKKITPFLEGGVSVVYYFNFESYWQYEQISSSKVVIDRVYNIVNPERSTVHPFFGFGATYDINKQIYVSVRSLYYYGFSVINNGVSPFMEQNLTISGDLHFKL